MSERIQRRIEAQERMAAAEQERACQAQQRDQQMARYDDGVYYPGYASRLLSERALLVRKAAAVLRASAPQERLGKPSPKRPTHHSSRSSGRLKAPAMP